MTADPIAALPTAQSRLHLGKLQLRVRSAEGVDWPAQWSDSARFRRGTEAAFEEFLAPLLDPSDPSVWIIQRLSLSAIVDGRDAAKAARCFSLSLRAAIRRALHGEDGQGIVRFPDRAAYLARLLADVARGDGLDRWYHFRYAHLRPLPVAQALAQAIAANLDESPAVLAMLEAGGELAAVIEALGESGAQRVVALLSGGPGDPHASPAVEALVAQEAIRAASLRWRRGAQLQLALFASAARLGSHLPASVILAAIARLLGRHDLTADPDAPPSEPDDDAARPRSRRAATAPTEPTLRRSAETPSAESPPRRARAPRRIPFAASIETPFAGLFLLWRSFIELGLESLLPQGVDGPRARLTLAATMAGRQRRGALADPALHWLTGYESADEATVWTPDPELPTAFGAHMTTRAAPPAIQLTEQRHGGFRVAQDRETGDWLELASSVHGESDASDDPTAAGLRPIARDLDYFGMLHDDPPHPSLVLLARAAFGDLGRRLMGLEGSSAAYLAANITGGPGRLDLSVEAQVNLPRAPLDLVLRMTGIDGTVISLTGGRSVRLRLPGAG